VIPHPSLVDLDPFRLAANRLRFHGWPDELFQVLFYFPSTLAWRTWVTGPAWK
jgi:hypothetical protein